MGLDYSKQSLGGNWSLGTKFKPPFILSHKELNIKKLKWKKNYLTALWMGEETSPKHVRNKRIHEEYMVHVSR